jgi:hypothetical protein
MADIDEPIPVFIKKEIKFPDGHIYQLQRPLTNYRSCHDGTPQEARMVFICTRSSLATPDEEFVMKIKVQSAFLPNPSHPHHPSPIFSH